MNESLFKELKETLPPIIARSEVPKYFGGIISAKTCANMDSLGTFVPKRLRIGRKIAYSRDDLLDWFSRRTTELA